MITKEDAREDAKKELEEFKLKFDNLAKEYPNISITGDNDGYLVAFHIIEYAKVYLG